MPELPEIFSSDRTFHHAAAHLEKQGVQVFGAPLVSLWHDPTAPKATLGAEDDCTNADIDGDSDSGNGIIDEQEDSVNDTGEGCVVELTASDAPLVKRGSGTVSQSHVYPPLPGTCPTLDDRNQLASDNQFISQQNAKNKRTAKSAGSEFVKIPFKELPYTPMPPELTHTPRTLLIHFGLMVVQIQYLLHTCLQVYTASQWAYLKLVPHKTRIFKVTVAFVFEGFTLAFLTRSHLLQLYWLDSIEHMPVRHACILTAFDVFLKSVADWIDQRRKRRCNRSKLAFMVIRGTDGPLPGIGKYTIQELMFMAGLWLGLTEAQLFDVPSRVARLIAAYRHLILGLPQMWNDVVRPAMQGTLLAPSLVQRQAYGRSLRVYGKLNIKIPLRLASLADEYEKNRDYDVFDWSLIALDLKQPRNLGHLISPTLWPKLSGDTSAKIQDDPLTQYFRSRGTDLDQTYLNPNAYTCLFPAATKVLFPRKPYTYYERSEKDAKKAEAAEAEAAVAEAAVAIGVLGDVKGDDSNGDGESAEGSMMVTESTSAVVRRKGKGRTYVWSLTSIPGVRTLATPNDGEREAGSFQYTVAHSLDVAIGPLEYGGLAIPRKAINGHTVHVLACWGDPNPDIPLRHTIEAVKAVHRKLLPENFRHQVPEEIEKKNTKKIGIVLSSRRPLEDTRDHRSQTLCSASPTILPSSPSSSSGAIAIPRPIRKRRTADAVVREGGLELVPKKRTRTERGIEMDHRKHPLDDLYGRRLT
ncbi:uncharacterized protein STEHIDRAFT_116777 [Stereum hirsutum FP-91666 SS1]|uniref:Uncharacterized protein n=1 Tax=Stereum hirsutum (strain FP-91666) TaxID=721885 RepID=R7RVM1_STEHR|nr:uncharacterized protein STEHIDRAFT_116777 [Stereum hirsutum FP-91666 SS1]EIM79119.1 hypothetical protein STEHIDRAFT_116777 [Stereum hirsutum FP-91666 SS1]